MLAAPPAARAADCPAKTYRNAALLIAISNPVLPEGPRRLDFAEQDVDRIAPFFENQFGRENVYKLKLPKDTTTAAISACLDSFARNAGANAKFVLFISARGFSSSNMQDGYILTSDAALDKLPANSQWQARNGISLTSLRGKLGRFDPNVQRFLLLDLCRDPVESDRVDNFINAGLLDASFLDAARTRRLILASTGSKPSLSNYYAASLAEVLLANPSLEMEKLFQDLKSKVLQKSGNKQSPDRPRTPNPAPAGCLLCKISSLPGPLLASAVPFLPQNPAPDSHSLINQAVAEEDLGQKIFIRYGEGNHFYGDPLKECANRSPALPDYKLCREDFEAAAAHFQKAAGKYASAPSGDEDENRRLLASLKERELFCRANALLLAGDRAGALQLLENPTSFQYAESHNLLGIALLDLTRYKDAEVQFNAAIRKAPHWAYPRHNLALALIEHGDYTAAEHAYRQAILTTPIGEKINDSPKLPAVRNDCFGDKPVPVVARPYLYYNLAVLLQRLNRLGEARKQYCLAQVSFRLSAVLNDPGAAANDPDGALPGLRLRAAQINLADVDNAMGVLLETKGKHDRARKQFDLARANNPALSAAIFNRARLEANLALARRDKAKAILFYEKAKAEINCGDPNEFTCRALTAALAELRNGTP